MEPLKKPQTQIHPNTNPQQRISKKRFTTSGSRRQPPRVHDKEKIQNTRLSPTKLKRGARSRTLRVQPKAGFGNTPKGKPGRTACRGNNPPPSPSFSLYLSVCFYSPELAGFEKGFGFVHQPPTKNSRCTSSLDGAQSLFFSREVNPVSSEKIWWSGINQANTELPSKIEHRRLSNKIGRRTRHFFVSRFQKNFKRLAEGM